MRIYVFVLLMEGFTALTRAGNNDFCSVQEKGLDSACSTTIFGPKSFGPMAIWDNGFCPISKIEEPNLIKIVSDIEEQCSKIDEEFKDDDNYNFINYFGNMFDSLMNGINSLNTQNNTNMIFLVGLTGAAKSTLSQILAGDNSKILSIPVREGSGEYILVDNGKIGTDAITSHNLYPDIIVDKESGFVFCDNPGFRDTRSPIHEIVSMYFMRKVLKYTNKIKIVLLTIRSSLKVGMYRDQFLNNLKHMTEFIHNIPKYESSLYLIATKVENEYVKQGGILQMVSDETVINDIGHFLNEVRQSLNDKVTQGSTMEERRTFYQKSIRIIDKLLEKNRDKYTRINIFRRADEEGPVSLIKSLQDERTSMRNMLLTDENFVSVKYDEFGLPISDSSLLFLNEVYHKMNLYITDLSQLTSNYLINRYDLFTNLVNNIPHVIEQLFKIKEKTSLFSNKVGSAKNPGNYIDIVKQFSDENKLKFDCLASFQNISKINEFLSSLEDLTDSTKYNPLSWNMTLKLVIDYFDEKLEEFIFLKDVFDLFSSYKTQQHRNLYNVRDIQHWGLSNQEQGLKINNNNFKKFIEKANLNSRYNRITTDQGLIDKVNSIIKLSFQHQIKTVCKNETLTIIDYYVVLSEIDGKYANLCNNARSIEVFALHTIFIDEDLFGEWFYGKHLTILAPIWTVIGTRMLSVEGQSGGGQMQKAGFEQIGQNGESGRPGGRFFGIGLIFNNGENLVINVKGGDGQIGQDGGDGRNGRNGDNGAGYGEGTHRGKPGEKGGDSGAGGKGGFGGKKGSITLYNIGGEDHKITFVEKDGKPGSDGRDGVPGTGGLKGCDLRVEVDKHTFLFIFVLNTNVRTSFFNCGEKNEDGILRNRITDPKPFDYPKIYLVPICKHIENLKKFQIDNYKTVLSDGIETVFINRMISKRY